MLLASSELSALAAVALLGTVSALALLGVLAYAAFTTRRPRWPWSPGRRDGRHRLAADRWSKRPVVPTDLRAVPGRPAAVGEGQEPMQAWRVPRPTATVVPDEPLEPGEDEAGGEEPPLDGPPEPPASRFAGPAVSDLPPILDDLGAPPRPDDTFGFQPWAWGTGQYTTVPAGSPAESGTATR